MSRYFLMRQGKRTSRYRRWTKLTIVADNATHLIPAATVSVGPNNDCPLLADTVRQAVQRVQIQQLLADAGYDSEANHRICREDAGIGSTVIPVNPRHRNAKTTRGKYRNDMRNHFPKQTFGNRWQVESVFSRFKRCLGYALRATADQSRVAECLVRVLTYNLMLLVFIGKDGFY